MISGPQPTQFGAGTQRERKKRHYRWFWRRGGGERTGGGAEKIGREQGESNSGDRGKKRKIQEK